MTPNQLFGGNPLAVIIRLVLLSIVVGIVLSALGVTPDNFLYSIQRLIQRVYDLGFGAFEWAFGYLLLGAVVVVPIWLVMRLFSAATPGNGGRRESGDGKDERRS